MTLNPREQVLAALSTVQDPDLHRDLVSLNMIEDLSVDGGRVAFTLVLTTSACPLKAEIEDNRRAAVGPLPWVTDLQLTSTSRVRKPKDPTAERRALEGVANVLAIGSGKGGVGKATVGCHLGRRPPTAA